MFGDLLLDLFRKALKQYVYVDKYLHQQFVKYDLITCHTIINSDGWEIGFFDFLFLIEFLVKFKILFFMKTIGFGCGIIELKTKFPALKSGLTFDI